ncbi:hypothetical protein ACKUB1_11550 [Methanospirillum stamsii]|uniref:Uncharacterized protein n=1 Tax=Methanospirillum stamsii TaxID=1277351 RepID=A0A2V2MVI1_9EURY|nr:hypothetical protein [Methanospirillum stamsii]PWR71902.1 hypothetical protein DLD82_12860 [Methanospirillum stamsii]
MLHAVRQRVTIEQDGTIHVRVPELKPGTVADVIILETTDQKPKKGLTGFIGKGKGCYNNANDVDTFIRNERNTWE